MWFAERKVSNEAGAQEKIELRKQILSQLTLRLVLWLIFAYPLNFFFLLYVITLRSLVSIIGYIRTI